MIAIIFIIALMVVGGFLVAIYNSLIRLKNQVANGLAQIDVQLKRRHDLIPNLVAIAKRYMTHEEQVLRTVTEARNLAQNMSKHGSIANADELAKLAQAENELSKALMSFYAVVENYPELKADNTLKELSDEIKNTENRIGFARQFYNDSVMFYNNQREVFPNNILANMFGFMPIGQLEFHDKSLIDVAPSINLNE